MRSPCGEDHGIDNSVEDLDTSERHPTPVGGTPAEVGSARLS